MLKKVEKIANNPLEAAKMEEREVKIFNFKEITIYILKKYTYIYFLKFIK